MTKTKEGYTFTVMSTNLHTMMNGSINSDRIYTTLRGHSLHIWGPKVIHVSLIVTKDGSFIPCTEEFMPTHLFSEYNGDGYVKTTSITDDVETVTSTCRHSGTASRSTSRARSATSSRPSL